jgi:fermentation-respiration switch protein FrsA (DUF1100 family)
MNDNASNTGNGSGSSRRRRIIRWVIIVLILLVVLYLGISGYAAGEVTKPKQVWDETTDPGTVGLEYEEVRFLARDDDIEIAAWYIPYEGASNVVILVHGRDASRADAVSGKFVDFAAALHEAGFAVMMIDLRGHGQSEGERYSFGVYERLDVLGAVDWLIEQGFEAGHIGTLGISLGGSATIGATADDQAIGALVVDGTFAELKPLIDLMWEEESGLPNFFLPGVYMMNRIIYGYSLQTIRPVDELAQISSRPILIVHCAIDEDVNIVHAEQLSEAAPHAETWIIADGCNHGETYRDFPQEYEQHVIAFFLESLP